jgi:hypothetical protein
MQNLLQACEDLKNKVVESESKNKLLNLTTKELEI